MTYTELAGGLAAGDFRLHVLKPAGVFPVRSLTTSFCFAAAALALACGAASAQSLGVGRTFDSAAPRALAASPQAESDPVTVEIAQGPQSFYFTAPYRQKLTERTPFTNQHAIASAPGQTAVQIRETDLSVGWRYRSGFQNDPALTLTYNVQATFDAGDSDAIRTYGRREYLTRIEIARDVGPVTPRVEVGQRYSPRSPFDAQTSRSTFGAAGVSYRFSSRSAMDAYFDYETAPAAGLSAQRSLSLNLSHRVSSRTDVSLYAFRSLSEDKAYNAGVRLTVQF